MSHVSPRRLTLGLDSSGVWKDFLDVYWIARMAFCTFSVPFQIRLATLHSILSPFDLDFALKYCCTVPHPHRHCAPR